MTGTPFDLLFSPIQVGKYTLKNRIVFLPHSHNYPELALPGDREPEYFADRAKGGVALIIYGCQYVASTGSPAQANASDPRVVELYKRVTDVVHEHGAYITAQLMHHGSSVGNSDEGLDWLMPYGASTGSQGGTISREMDYDEIQRVIEAYRVAARNVKEGGFDGIQVRLNAGLTGEFTSAFYNKRTDQYGGSVENRLRFGLEIIDAVRDEIGPDLMMDVRHSVEESVEGGYGIEEGQEIARLVAATGKIDFITTAIGIAGTTMGVIYLTGPQPLPVGYGVEAAAAIKQAVDIPVVAQGRINDPVQAEEVLAKKQGDLIGMCRGLIADPEFPNKAREGRLDDIRKCIAYHEVCQGRNAKRRQITCVYNPAAGRERELGIGTLKPAAVKKKVMVVGGGPAGLKAAEVAARRGHQVTLYEMSDRLGGQINLAVRLPNRDYMGEITAHSVHQIEKLGVEIRLGVEITPEMVLAMAPDAVVVATGAVPLVPDIPGMDQENVVTYWDVAREQGVKGDSVLIYDPEGYWPGAGIAELLASQGKKVHIVTPNPMVGANIQHYTRLLWQQRVEGKGVTQTTDAEVKAISGKTVTLSSPHWNGREWTVDEVDTVVLACGGSPKDSLYKELTGKVGELRLVGDCEAPMRLERSIYAAELVGRAI